MTIRYLATGESMLSLSLGFRIGHSTCCPIVRKTCLAIYHVLASQYLPVPTTETWLAVSEDSDKLWDFPHCIGALDRKHIRIQAPANSGSDFYNYKGFFSIVLLAVCDARYRFIITDVGSLGREGDKAIFSSSVLNKKLSSGELQIPDPTIVPRSSKILPCVIVGDEAFPLRTNLIRPYPGVRSDNLSLIKKVYNYRLVNLVTSFTR